MQWVKLSVVPIFIYGKHLSAIALLAFHPQEKSLPRSQVLFINEVVMALEYHGLEPRGAFVTVDHNLHPWFQDDPTVSKRLE
jgi:hypothetical protein